MTMYFLTERSSTLVREEQRLQILAGKF